MRQMSLRKFAIATSTLAVAALFSFTAQAQHVGFTAVPGHHRIYISPHYHFGPYVADQSGLPWYAVRAYYNGGPWCSVAGGFGAVGYGTAGGWAGSYTCYSGWDDYKSRNGIGCDPGTPIKGGDGIIYVCQ
jgi:hypothetical protein